MGVSVPSLHRESTDSVINISIGSIILDQSSWIDRCGSIVDHVIGICT